MPRVTRIDGTRRPGQRALFLRIGEVDAMTRTTLSLVIALGVTASACSGNNIVRIPDGNEAGSVDAGIDVGHVDASTKDASDAHDKADTTDGTPGADVDAEPPFEAGEDVTTDAGCSGPSECPTTGSACIVATCTMGECGTESAAADTPCTDDGGDVCNGSGKCVSSNGSPCTGAAQCLSDHCSGDGYCCSASCKGSCETCSTGTCADVGDGETTATCNGGNECDGAGHCLGGLGEPCSLASQCLTDECSGDGFCCETSCDGTCETCSSGTCADVAEGDMTATCDGTSACDGSGNCLEDLGQTCAEGTQCASGNCSSDGVCCVTPCTGSCVECGTFDGELCDDVAELGTTSTCDGTNACDGAGDCLLANGQPCTTASQCAGGVCGKLLTCK
jgi:hypothetical protein